MMKFFLQCLILQVVIKGYVTADGSDGKHSGGDGGVISTTSASPKALARPGKCKGNKGLPGRRGTVKGWKRFLILLCKVVSLHFLLIYVC